MSDALASRFVVDLADRRTFPPRTAATTGGGSPDMGNAELARELDAAGGRHVTER